MTKTKPDPHQPDSKAVEGREVTSGITTDTGWCRRCAGISFDLTALYDMDQNSCEREVELCLL
jgi:hypothetical protein